MDSMQGPVVILWDIENCPMPNDVRPEDVASNIRLAVRAHPSITGAVTSFSAYGDFNFFPRRLREGFQRTGVKLVDVPNGRKDAADKAIMVDMFLFALDHRPPSTIILISGDVDFAPALHIFGQRGYTIILAIPASVAVSSALCSAGRFVWDWPSIARGTGLVPPKNLASQGMTPISLSVLPVLEPVQVWIPEQSSHLSRSSFDDHFDMQNEEAAIVYGGNSSRTNQVSREFSSQSTQNISEGHYDNCSTQPQSSQVGMMEGACEDPVSTYQDKWWVKPGDIDRLKEQMVMLLEKSGGTLPLIKVPSEYLKLYGRPLCLAEYGATKLAHLFSKMNDAFIVIGQGQEKTLCLTNNCDAENLKKCASTPIILKQEHKVSCISTPSPSDKEVDDEAGSSPGFDAGDEYNDGIKRFKLEVHQELPREQFGQPAQNISEEHYGNCSTHPQSSQVGMTEGACKDPVSMDQDKWLVKPADIYRLKEQMVMLLQKSGGTLPLVKVSPQYLKLYGRHLLLAEYGAAKLVHLFSKMNDAFVVVGQGPEKTLCLINNCDAENLKKCASTPIILKQEHKVSCISTPSPSDKEVDDEAGSSPGFDAGDEYNDGIKRFKLEVHQELPREHFGQPAQNISEEHYGNCSTHPQSSQVGMTEGACKDPVSMDQDKWLVKPADIYRLKEQMVMLLQKSGGTLPLVKVSPQYLKLYGRHLLLAEYGAAKLVHLFSKMNDAFVVVGQGPEKTLCLINNCDAENLKKCASTPIILKQEHKVSCISTPFPEGKPGCAADEKVDDEASSSPGFYAGNEYNKGIEGFQLEVHQELPRELFGQSAQNISEGHCDNCSTLPQSSQVGMMEGTCEGLVNTDQDKCWAKPGDIDRLKEQMVMLLEKSGGTLPIIKVSSEYLKLYGRPLHLAEYGAAKLVRLFSKMNDAFIVIGQGLEKTLCFTNNCDAEILKKMCKLANHFEART